MAKKKDTAIWSQKRWSGGISDYPKESAAGQIPSSYYFSRAIDYRTDPQALTLLPASVKESGSTVTDLIKWSDIVPTTLTTFHYGNAGNIYSRTNTTPGVWTDLHTVANSHGNGLGYFIGDEYLYYTTDTAIGRYGPMYSATPQFTDNFLQAAGGVPTNTASIWLQAASDMYAYKADAATLDITGNLTVETFFYANSLPTVGNSMTLLGKWDESGATRSYKLDLFGVSGYFGAGTDGSWTVSGNTTESVIDSACTGTASTQALSATNASFAQGQVILIHQTQGTNADQWERNTIQGYTAGTITLTTPLIGTYTTGAQVRVLKQYTNVTVNAILTAKAWNGTTGGLLMFLANGTVSGSGAIVGDGCGFRGGAYGTINTNGWGQQGESYTGLGTNAQGANGGGGGGGQSSNSGASTHGGGAGAGHAIVGANGANGNGTNQWYGGYAGGSYDSADLTTGGLGSGGGGGGSGVNTNDHGGNGGNGGGFIDIAGVTWSFTGTVSAAGIAGSTNGNGPGNGGDGGAGGAGSAGSIRIQAQTATLGTNLITALGAVGGYWNYNGSGTYVGGNGNGGNSSNGIIDLNYLTSYSGSTNPGMNVVQDNTLVTTTTIQARLGISNDGTAYEYLTQNLDGLTTAAWERLSVSWVASTSTASFYINGAFLGTSTGTKTAIASTASRLTIGANNSGSGIANYFDGYLNSTRLWANAQSATQIAQNCYTQISGASAGLAAYYQFNNALTDGTANGNNLTGVNTPTYVTAVPFSAPTTRPDIDTQNTNTGQTYSLLAAIMEDSVDSLPFTPESDPQKSVGFYISTKGTGAWTVTVHDQQNNVVATQTIANAQLPASGFVEFIFTTPWRIIPGKSYHMHLTGPAASGAIVTGTSADFSTAEYATYFGFLVTDTQYHPVVSFQYQPLGGSLTGAMIIGNERYLAVWDGANYFPNFITFSPGWKVRCFGFWRNYLAIGVWKGGNIYDFNQGRVYFWTGYQPAFDFYIDVPEGQINAMFGVDSDLYMYAGYRGQLLNYQGGFFYETGNTSAGKLKRMPLLAPADTTEVYPGAFTMWRGLLYAGLYGASSSTTAVRGTYAYGTYNPYYPQSLSCDYIISTGNMRNTVSIGDVYPVGEKLLVAWQDGIAYGVDVIDYVNNPPAPSGEIQSLILDDEEIYKYKDNLQLRGDFTPLTSGQSISLEFNPDRKGWVTSAPDTQASDYFMEQPINPGRTREVQVGVTLYAGGGAPSPTFLGLSLLPQNNETEGQF